jgi:prepilin-type N-terminal cleavage/methylation domain-containing protein
MRSYHSRAFSLVELSIVLVILGLLTGGILAGQSLIRASELRAATSEYQRYTTAVHAFRDKYFALPGDFNKAQSFWGVAAVCPGLSGTAAAGVCNGDGDGTITRTVSTSNEIFGAWEHLAMAGLVEGTYTGNTIDAATASSGATAFGTNIPGSKLKNAGWTIYHYGTQPISNVNYFDGYYGTFFFFGVTTGISVSSQPALKPEEAWNMDTKLDDGKPALGLIRSMENDGGLCTDLAASAVASLAASVYVLSTTSIECALMMRTGL